MIEIGSELRSATDAQADGFERDITPRDAQKLPMADVYLAMMQASALIAAGRIGLFEALANGPMAAGALSEAVGASEIGVLRLTDILVETGHLERRGLRLANAPTTARWFTSVGEVDYSAGLLWTADAWTMMDDLSDAVRRGGPRQLLWDKMVEEPALGVRFARYMRAFAYHLAGDLRPLVKVPQGSARLLDLGGSHGIHSISLCRQNPNLSAVVIDLDTALDGTNARIQDAGLADRISVRPADIRGCDWGEGYDVVLYLSIAHNMSAHENERIFAHVRRVLRPGGKLIIHDYPAETTPGLFRAAFGLTLLVETGTRTFAYAEFSHMLAKAGFSTLRQHVLAPADKGTIIIAER